MLYNITEAITSNSDMEELAKKTTNGDLAELANFMNDFFLSVSDHLPRLDKDDNVQCTRNCLMNLLLV